MGEPSDDSFPGSRFTSVSWISNSSFWLFGGVGYDTNGNFIGLNY